MKISRNLFPFLSVVFLLSIFFMLISPSFSYATSSVRYWSSSDSVSYGGKTTYKMTIKDIEEKKGICIEAETSSPNYCASCSEHGEVGTLYSDAEIKATWPDFYMFAQKVVSLYKTNSVPGSYDQFANAHLALSKKYSNECNVSSSTCTSIVSQVEATSDPTTCYEMYLVKHDTYQDAVYFKTSKTVDCPGTTAQTATYSSTSTVQYGTQTGTSLSIESSTAISVSFYHTLKRTDSETSYTPSDQNVYYTYGANPANPSGTSSKVVPTTAGVKVGEETSVSVSPGSTVCRKIKYTPTSKSSNESTTAGPGSSEACITVTSPPPPPDVQTTASFQGYVSATSPDGKLSGDASSGFEGNGRDTSFKIRFYYYLNRTDSENPSSATVGYTYSAAQNADNSSSESSTITLGNNSGDTYLTYLDLTIPVSIGSSAAACGGILYNDTITYTNGSPTSYTTDYQSTCVSLSNPPVSDDANFSGESAVSQWSGLTYVSASGNDLEYTYYRDDLTVNPEKTLFPTTFAHKVKRIDSRDTPSTSITRWYSYRGSKDSEVYYDGGNSSALAKNSALSQVKSDLVNVPISLGDSGTYCQYITYDATVHHWTDGTITRSEYDGKSDPACLTINNPKYRTQTIVSRTDDITVSGSTNAPSVSGATLKTGTEYEANAKTIGVTFHHSLSRGADSYTSDSVSPTYAVRETRTIAIPRNVTTATLTKVV